MSRALTSEEEALQDLIKKVPLRSHLKKLLLKLQTNYRRREPLVDICAEIERLTGATDIFRVLTENEFCKSIKSKSKSKPTKRKAAKTKSKSKKRKAAKTKSKSKSKAKPESKVAASTWSKPKTEDKEVILSSLIHYISAEHRGLSATERKQVDLLQVYVTSKRSEQTRKLASKTKIGLLDLAKTIIDSAGAGTGDAISKNEEVCNRIANNKEAEFIYFQLALNGICSSSTRSAQAIIRNIKEIITGLKVEFVECERCEEGVACKSIQCEHFDYWYLGHLDGGIDELLAGDDHWAKTTVDSSCGGLVGDADTSIYIQNTLIEHGVCRDADIILEIYDLQQRRVALRAKYQDYGDFYYGDDAKEVAYDYDDEYDDDEYDDDEYDDDGYDDDDYYDAVLDSYRILRKFRNGRKLMQSVDSGDLLSDSNGLHSSAMPEIMVITGFIGLIGLFVLIVMIYRYFINKNKMEREYDHYSSRN